MEQFAADFLNVDWTSPSIFPILVGIASGLLAKVGVITARNHRVACIAIASAVGLGFAAQTCPSPELTLDRQVLLRFVYGLCISAITWFWLYMAVYGEFRQQASEPRKKSDAT